MISIVFFNNKGGVGKTTLLCNLAAYMSIKHSKKVLVVDADPQCNSTTYSIPDKSLEEIYSKSKRNTIDYFFSTIRRGEGYVKERMKPERSERFKFDIIPGDPRLALSEDLLASDWKSATSGDPRGLQTTLIFKSLTHMYKEYDFIFFDVGPSLGAINRAIMLASNNFIIPMSVDLFSLMALENIKLSLGKWKDGFTNGLSSFKKEENEDYIIDNEKVNFDLTFIGYVMQQYKARTEKGERRHVNAYEKISKNIPEKIDQEIISNFGNNIIIDDALLGEIHNLHSLVPMSQTSRSPIFSLKAADGVVGAHFAKVSEAEDLFKGIYNNLITNLEKNND